MVRGRGDGMIDRGRRCMVRGRGDGMIDRFWLISYRTNTDLLWQLDLCLLTFWCSQICCALFKVLCLLCGVRELVASVFSGLFTHYLRQLHLFLLTLFPRNWQLNTYGLFGRRGFRSVVADLCLFSLAISIVSISPVLLLRADLSIVIFTFDLIVYCSSGCFSFRCLCFILCVADSVVNNLLFLSTDSLDNLHTFLSGLNLK